MPIQPQFENNQLNKKKHSNAPIGCQENGKDKEAQIQISDLQNSPPTVPNTTTQLNRAALSKTQSSNSPSFPPGSSQSNQRPHQPKFSTQLKTAQIPQNLRNAAALLRCNTSSTDPAPNAALPTRIQPSSPTDPAKQRKKNKQRVKLTETG